MLHIRDANLEDFAALMQLYQELHPADPSFNENSAREVFQQILAASGLHIFLLVNTTGELIASCYLNVIPNLTRGARPYAIIENVITAEAKRGQGHGKAIMAHALAQAWQAGCYKVMLQTGSRKPATHAFYQACGFSGTDKHGYVAWQPGYKSAT